MNNTINHWNQSISMLPRKWASIENKLVAFFIYIVIIYIAKAGKYVKVATEGYDTSNAKAVSTSEADMQKVEIAISLLNDMFIWYSTIEGNKIVELFIRLSIASMYI
jgi:hypothetical protein